MADYTTRARVELSVNGKQAEQILKTLEKDAERLRNKMDEAAKIGDKGTLKSLQRELKQTEKQINIIKGASQSVGDVLKSLDKASPNELRKTLNKLKRELNGIERGSAAWEVQTQKIRAVREELAKVRQSMALQESTWSRFNKLLNKCQTTILGMVAAVTGLVMAGKKAVTSYAEMEQEMANVRKFTGMTEEEVASLNEEFKKIDTRSSREDLNKLAQEAGRLGKTSQEDVLGFVKAADQINVALDDLGDGATLTLSKLTGIFGDEERLGTEKALLSVGSVINELSQNCSASAPYLAEFASRMGGVGSQAGMTVQQIMAFGAVLDSNQQALEASSTALSQVIVRIYQDPAKYARVAGMDVKNFANLVKTDMNAALLEFLSALNKAGNMDVLSPMFKDMGENGSRAIQAMSTLAKHIDDVREQQMNANIAFAEATSITNEFNVQNNTVQAGLDKAKNKLNEIAVDLGQKLMPLMSGVISSSTLAMKALSVIVDAFIKYKVEILTVTAAIAAYNAILLVAATRTKLVAGYMTLVNGILGAFKGIAATANLLWEAGTVAVLYFRNGLSTTYEMQERMNAAMQRMKTANCVGLILTIAAAVFLLARRFREGKSAAEEFAEARRKIDAEAETSTKSQISLLDQLYEKTQDQTAAQEERLAAVKKLRDIYPDYFKDLSNEAILAGEAAQAYTNLRDSILESARAKGRESRIGDLEKEIQELQTQYDKERKPFVVDQMKAREQNNYDARRLKSDPLYQNAEHALKILEEKYQSRIDQLKKEQESLASMNLAFELKNMDVNVNSGSGNKIPTSQSVGVAPSSAASVHEERFKAEKEWREKSEAMAKIFYATGVTNSIDYYRSLDEIAVEYNSRLLQREDLTEDERLKIATDFAEAQKAQAKRFTADSVEEENKRYNQSVALLKQYYLDGRISQKAYEDFTIEAEAEHLQTLVGIYEEGSEERLKAEEKLNDMLIQQMQKRQEESKKLEQQYAEIKKQHFGLNEPERMAAYENDLAMLDVVLQRELAAIGNNAAEKLRIEEAYEQAKLALKKKYNQLSSDDEKSKLEKALQQLADWFGDEGTQRIIKGVSTMLSGMYSIFTQLSSLVKAELELQTAAIEKRYDKEIQAAEGNSYKVAQLEKKKEQEIAKLKNEANKKMFAMQVFQAVAQTATNALSAYGAGLQVGGIAGLILAPIAAAMAVAAGAIQIAAIKKQQAAASATGYAEGGFTKEGDKYEPVGIVHAGEWVASQSLTHNPRIRPILESLDYAQKTNTYPVMSPDYVSMRLAAPSIVAQTMPSVSNSSSRLEDAISKLNRNLEKPFVSVTTVAGDKGVAKAQERYDRLMKNKS